MKMVKIRTFTESKPLNRLRSNFAQLITSRDEHVTQNLCQFVSINVQNRSL